MTADNNSYALFQRLLEIMAKLRSQSGCPWDREQTHETLIPFLLEETHEVASAIYFKQPNHLAEELGDVLLQVVFHSQIAAEQGHFTFSDVVRSIVDKLIRRHPHVFGDRPVKTSHEVLENWRRIKQDEKGEIKDSGGILESIPTNLPQLVYAQKLQNKAAEAGFDWETTDQVIAKVKEEWSELSDEIERSSEIDRVEDEFGDVLFALVNLGRFLDLNCEESLRKANLKFFRRFANLEKEVGGADHMRQMTLDELDAIWNRIKHRQENLLERRTPDSDPMT